MKKLLCILFVIASAATSFAQTTNIGLNFDGFDDRVIIPDHAAYDLGTGTFTIEAWIKVSPSQNGPDPTFISNSENPNHSTGFVLHLVNGRLTLTVAGGTFGSFGNDLRDNNCHHIAIGRTGTSFRIYIDGVLVVTHNSTTPYNINSNHPFWFGGVEYTSTILPYRGLIHEVRFWNVERTSTQIIASANSYLTGTETGLIGYWRMNDNAGQLVNDLSPTNNDGYLGFSPNADSADPLYATACFCAAPTATFTVTGPVAFCQGGSVLFTGNSGTGLTYQWKKNNVNIAGATAQTYTATTSGVYILEVTKNGCTKNSTGVNVVVSQPLAPTITEAGIGDFCSSSTVRLEVQSSSDYTYQWFEEDSPIPNATTSQLTTFHNANYRVAGTNTCGTFNSPVYPLNNWLFANYDISTIEAQGNTTFCGTASVNVYLDSRGFFPYDSPVYQWYRDGVAIPAGSSGYTATQPGTYFRSVYGTNNINWPNTCQTPVVFSNPIIITQSALPSAVITPSGTANICSGSSVTLQAPVSANRSYQWFKGGTPITSATASSYTTFVGGSYKVTVTNTLSGCSKTTAGSTKVTVNALPAATITPQGPTTFCAGGSVVLRANGGTGLTYKWKKGANYINNATFKNYTATTAGNYRVQVTNADACSKTSALVTVSVPCREGETATATTGFDFSLYPNPSSGAFTIQLAATPASPVSVELTDMIGKIVKRFTVTDETTLVDNLNVADGIYYLTVYNKEDRVAKKVVIRR